MFLYNDPVVVKKITVYCSAYQTPTSRVTH